ncbi:MAG: DUF1648 domain-containing protein [Planctomycetota bacterium]
MRAIFVGAFIVNVVLALVSIAVLPSQVAVHFGFHGEPDSWGSSLRLTVVFLAVDVLLFCVLYFSPHLGFAFPDLMNLPNKAYWLAEENKGRAKAAFTSFMCELGTAVLAFLLAAILLTVEANLSAPVRLNTELFYPALILLLLYAVYWSVRSYRAFRIPVPRG